MCVYMYVCVCIHIALTFPHAHICEPSTYVNFVKFRTAMLISSTSAMPSFRYNACW